MRLLIAALVLSLFGIQQPPPRPPAQPASPMQPPRDPGRRPPPEPTGTAIIRGTVVGADSGSPVRRASVNLMMMNPPIATAGSGASAAGGRGATPPGVTVTMTSTVINGAQVSVSNGLSFLRPRTATTDIQGNFEFRDLPPGSYRITASPGQYNAGYLNASYGAKKPNTPTSSDPGTPVELGAGQKIEKLTVRLPRGAVITGRVIDENGDPLTRVQVYTLFYAQGSGRGMRTGSGGQTDDRGEFRLFGLAPGEYAVVAEARMNTYVPPNAPPETEEEKTGFMTTYYPGTADEGAAQRVVARSGAETSGIQIQAVSGRLFHISGMIVDSQGRTATRLNGMLMRRTGAMGTSSFGFSIDDQGKFQMRSIPPGDYRLTVRQQIARPGGMNDGPPEIGEFANVPLVVNADMDNLLVTMSPGVTITGSVMFESGPPQPQPGQTQAPQIRVTAQNADPNGMSFGPGPQPALVTSDYTFTMKGLSGEYLLRVGAVGQYLKSVVVGGDDITDTGREFKSGDKVSIVLTTHVSTVEGTVTDSKGEPATDAAIIAFSEDKTSWRTSSIRTRRAAIDQTGHYRLMGVLPGRYFVIAAPRERINVPFVDAAYFEQLAKDATTFVVGEDEQRQVDLKVVGGS